MSPRYTAADVVRWQQADEGRLPMKLAQLNDDTFIGRRDFVFSGLHLLHEGLGYTYVALQRPDVARAHFRESCQYVLRLFEMPHGGESVSPDRLRAGYCQSWLIALAIGADGLAFSLADSFKQQYFTGTNALAGIEQVALALQLLIKHCGDSTAEALPVSATPALGNFRYYVECLRAIAERREDRVIDSLDLAAKDWQLHIARTHRGLPQSVCFIPGLGLLRLAERFIGHPIEFSNAVIPSELFSTPGAA